MDGVNVFKNLIIPKLQFIELRLRVHVIIDNYSHYGAAFTSRLVS